MPGIIHAKVILEGRSTEAGIGIQADLTCIRALLDNIFAIHKSAFQDTFGTIGVAELLADWTKNGLPICQVPNWGEKLRRAAFEADNLGEASAEFRNPNEPEVAPGVIPVFCAILDHFAGRCGADGIVMLMMPDERQ